MFDGLPRKHFACVVSDPPWAFATRSAKGLAGRPQHYSRMSLAELKAMPVAGLVASDCWLFMWTTGPHLRQAFDVIDAWGFRYSGMGFVWVKLNPSAASLFFMARDLAMGGGYTTRKNAEFCLLARRGQPKRLSKAIHEVIISPRREHSRKPDEARARIERYCAGPYLELFARESKPGWTTWGAEATKFDKVAA